MAQREKLKSEVSNFIVNKLTTVLMKALRQRYRAVPVKIRDFNSFSMST